MGCGAGEGNDTRVRSETQQSRTEGGLLQSLLKQLVNLLSRFRLHIQYAVPIRQNRTGHPRNTRKDTKGLSLPGISRSSKTMGAMVILLFRAFRVSRGISSPEMFLDGGAFHFV